MRKQELHPRTAILNKSQKNKSKLSRVDALAWLATEFPNAFDNTLRIRPLKIGIMVDILEHADKAAAAGISRNKLREAVVLFTRRLDYLACLKARDLRIDLLGNKHGEVTLEEAQHAAVKIKKRIEKGVRNSRKIMAEVSEIHPGDAHKKYVYSTKPIVQPGMMVAESFMPIYPARAQPLTEASPAPAKASSVIVKHKTTRQYDPSVVARLKEKLGLSKAIEKKETTE